MVKTKKFLKKQYIKAKRSIKRQSKKYYKKLKNVVLKIKNTRMKKKLLKTLKKKHNQTKLRKFNRIQYGCSKMKGGGPLFQPLTDFSRTIEGGVNDIKGTFLGENVEI
jgi:hypothetical protein